MVRGGPGPTPERACGVGSEPVREVLSSLIGVPAAILLAAGLGIVGVTLVSRVRRSAGRPPIRWAHLALGVGFCGAGMLLLELQVSVFGVH